MAAQLEDSSLEQPVSEQLAALAAAPPSALGGSGGGPTQLPATAGDEGAPQPLLTAVQLRSALDWQIAVLAASLLGQQRQGPSAGGGGEEAAAAIMQAPPAQRTIGGTQLEHAWVTTEAAAQRLLQREPDSPRSHYAAGLAVLHPGARAGGLDGNDGSSVRGCSASQHFLRAAELGRQQGSAAWAAAGAAAALQHVHAAPQAERQSTEQAARAAVERAEAALQQGGGQLPPSWLHSLTACLASVKTEGQLALDGKRSNSSTGTAAAAAAQGAGKGAKDSALAPAPLLPHQRADPRGARVAAGERAAKQQLWLTVCLDSCLLLCLTVCCESCLGACCEECCNACCGACCGT